MDTAQLRIELHCHTVFSSDGHITYPGLIAAARRRKLDAVVITDHDTIEGALDFRRQNRRDGHPLEIFVGEERTLEDGSHLIGLFLQEPLRERTLLGILGEIRQQGAVVVFPHPFRHRDGVFRLPRPELQLEHACFEIFNPRSSYIQNQAARQLLERGWTGVGGSDAHFDADLGECVNLVRRNGDVESSLRLALARVAPIQVLGVRQKEGQAGRRYAPWYYRVKPYVRVPRCLVPTANRAYRMFRSQVHGRRAPVLELKHESD